MKVSTQPLRDHAVAQDASMRDQMQGMRLALTNALKELLQVWGSELESQITQTRFQRMFL